LRFIHCALNGLGAKIVHTQALETPLNGRTAPRYKRHHKEDQEDNEQDFGDFSRQACDAYESEYTGDNGDN
jgi:hypothetical protein